MLYEVVGFFGHLFCNIRGHITLERHFWLDTLSSAQGLPAPLCADTLKCYLLNFPFSSSSHICLTSCPLCLTMFRLIHSTS